jgi:signal transduction histidine kinase
MKKITVIFAVAWATSLGVQAADYASAAEAEAIVSMVVKAINTDKAGTFKEIDNKDKKWVRKDLYPVVYGMDGKCLAHGQNPKQIGKDLMEIVDADGKEFVKERVQLAGVKVKFWQDYKFTDPVTKKVLPKSTFCQKTSDMIVCAGIYKR